MVVITIEHPDKHRMLPKPRGRVLSSLTTLTNHTPGGACYRGLQTCPHWVSDFATGLFPLPSPEDCGESATRHCLLSNSCWISRKMDTPPQITVGRRYRPSSEIPNSSSIIRLPMPIALDTTITASTSLLRPRVFRQDQTRVATQESTVTGTIGEEKTKAEANPNGRYLMVGSHSWNFPAMSMP